MAAEYRDIGRLNNGPYRNLLTETPKSLVFRATHDGEGIRLPYRYRSFISFSYNGKWIEDFDLIAVVDGDRMSKGLTGQFEDLTSVNDVTDGQYYNSTHYHTNTLSFTLATDGIDSRKLEDFIHWFLPGKSHELILSEHPNRGIMARVSEQPVMEVLPFEKEVEMNLGGVTYTTSVTNFKGTISLTFTMDEPFWYSIINIFGNIDDNGNYVEEWDGVDYTALTPAAKEKFKDLLKIVYEDGIPVREMIEAPMIFGNSVYASGGSSIIGRDITLTTAADYSANSSVPGYHNNGSQKGLDSNYYFGAVAEDANSPTYSLGVVSGAYVASLSKIKLSLAKGDYIYLYYAGTAPAPIRFTFTIPIIIDDNTGYVKSIASVIHPQGSRTYNTITFECLEKLILYVTTPNFLTSYNKVIKLLNGLAAGTSWETLRSLIRDEIRHPVIRAIAINIINIFAPVTTKATPIPTSTVIPEGLATGQDGLYPVVNGKTSKIGYTDGTYETWTEGPGTDSGVNLINSQESFLTSNDLSNIKIMMTTIFKDSNAIKIVPNYNDIEGTDVSGSGQMIDVYEPKYLPVGIYDGDIEKSSLTVTIDSRTGEATGIFKYRYIDGKNSTYSYATLEENVGDMFNSNYIKLKDRNVFTNDLRILEWKKSSKQNSYRIYHDFGKVDSTVTLTDIEILYKNLYF